MELNTEFKKTLERILKTEILSTLPIPSTKNPTSLVESRKGKFIVKILSDENLFREMFGNSFFGNTLGIRVPRIAYSKEGMLVTEYEDLSSINSIEELVSIIVCYQRRYDSLTGDQKKVQEIYRGIDRDRLDDAFKRNTNLFEEYDAEKIAKILLHFGNFRYREMPVFINHGDARRRNFFRTKSNEPFLLDFEKVCLDSPTFDVSTSVYSDPEHIAGIISYYLNLNDLRSLNRLGKDFLIDAILTDVLRLAIHDTFSSLKKGKLKERRKHNQKVIEAILN